MSPQERCEAIAARKGGELARLLRKALPAALSSQATSERKYIRLVEIADKVQDLIGPYAPCKRGCSHCCRMPIGIGKREADRIAQATGRTYRIPQPIDGEEMLARANGDVRKAEEWMWDAMVRRHTGMPCPFLKNEACSIYGVRPIACRLHHVVEDDAQKCRAAGSGKPAMVRMSEFDAAREQLFRGEPFGDIREFFGSS